MKVLKSVMILILLVGCVKDKPLKQKIERDISAELLLLVKRSKPTDIVEKEMAILSRDWIAQNLSNDQKKKAFWLNVYNAFYQIEAAKEQINLDSIFTKKLISIAGYNLSFDDVEHGIIRGKPEYQFDNLSTDSVDYRIHFALNCGAKSCPPIAFYDSKDLNDQLETATKLYLTQETQIDDENKIVSVTQLMEWFSEDFGGEENIPVILYKYLERDFSGYDIKYIPFDWTQNLANYQK